MTIPAAAPRRSDEPRSGLDSAEAHDRLARDGFNELPRERRRSVARAALEVLREPMFALLMAAAGVYAIIGEFGESLVLLGFATASVSIAAVQRGRSERALEALRDLSSPRALVIRDGVRQRVPGREVVRGDLVVLSEGDRIPADGGIVSGEHLEVDESLLTGESLPVRKSLADGTRARVAGGTLVTRGTALAEITATGSRSAIGVIGASLATLAREQPHLERETRRLVVAFGVAALLLSSLSILLYGFARDSWLDAVLGGIALGMALLPEEFPLVLTVFTVMGAWRLSRLRVLTRRASIIETLGATTVLCTDKTGTLTRNLMSVACLDTGAERWQPDRGAAELARSPALAGLLETAARASEEHRVDPMERALLELADQAHLGPRGGSPVREYPLHPGLLAVTRVWRSENGGLVATKGAPEAIARLCGLDARARAAMESRTVELAAQGMRVLGVARAAVPDVLPDAPQGFGFQWLGLVAFADPLRDSATLAVRECQAAGIRVLMITGDFPATARAIAQQAGIDSGSVVSGEELASLDQEAFARRVRETAVFARISPAQKLRIVEVLKSAGEVVAMTGDGVNDAAALKAAHVGIAMGGRGTDVAREAASIVLLDDDLGSVVRGVRIGRRIRDNLRKAMGYICAIHVPIAGLALLPVLLDWPLLLTPMLIALLELIIDPACSVVLEAEPEEEGVMQRPPRAPSEALLPRGLLFWSLAQGTIALLAVAGVFVAALRAAWPVDEVRTLVFLALVGAIVSLIFVNRSFSSSLAAAFGRRNGMLWWGLGLAGVVLALVLGVPAARGFLGLAILAPSGYALVGAVAAGLLLLLQVAKRGWRHQLER
jgi:Ca2+-transporting ATPase